MSLEGGRCKVGGTRFERDRQMGIGNDVNRWMIIEKEETDGSGR